jgi:hypothetical protein
MLWVIFMVLTCYQCAACCDAVCAQGWIAQRDLGFIYQPTFAHSYSVTNSTEDLRQALAAAEVRNSNICTHLNCPSASGCSTPIALGCHDAVRRPE